jgi:hypothetical protein
MEGKMKLTRNWVIGLAAILAWVNLAASQERPKPAAPKLPAGVKIVQDLQYVENGHERNHLDLYLPEKVEGNCRWSSGFTVGLGGPVASKAALRSF